MKSFAGMGAGAGGGLHNGRTSGLAAGPDQPNATVFTPLGGGRVRPAMSQARLARRGRMVTAAKRVLPLGAAVLLALVVLWPDLSRDADRRRLSLQQSGVIPQAGEMIDPIYHSVDDRGRPYTVTAARAHEREPGVFALTDPKADLTQDGGSWLVGQAKHGTYAQHLGNLDVWGEVQLYRDDGTTMTTSSANIDLRNSAAAGSEMVHVEGPFGTLDAQNFASTDRGAVTQFGGPGRLILNARSK